MPNKGITALLAGSVCMYIWVFYFVERQQSLALATAFSLLFLCYAIVMKKREQISLRTLLFFSVVIRLVALFAIPALSDDVYRFLWDGHLMQNGFNPFSFTPADFIEQHGLGLPGLNKSLYELLNSKAYFTIYPPIQQGVNYVVTAIAGPDIKMGIVLNRSVLLAIEFCLLALALKMFKKDKYIFIYFLNPLVVLEVSGNLHMEGAMLFFLAGFFFFFYKKKHVMGFASLALAVASKLLPLMVFPFVFNKMNFKKAVATLLFTVLIIGLLFYPLLDVGFLMGMKSSLALYFRTFEFNASVFYLVRQIGFWLVGYNVIQTAGPMLALTTFACIIALSFYDRRQNFTWPQIAQYCLVIYFLFTNTLHPWYVVTLVGLSMFTRAQFSLVWSFFIFFTYLGYSDTGYTENYYLITIEYFLVLLVLLKDLNIIKVQWPWITN